LRKLYVEPVPGILDALESVESERERIKDASEKAIAAREAAVPGLAGLLAEHPNPSVRIRAASLLARMGPTAKDALPAIRSGTSAYLPAVREAARAALDAVDPGSAKSPVPSPKFAPRPFMSCRANRGPLAEAAWNRGVSEAVEGALDWLARHQGADGAWRCSGFEQCCKRGRCGGAGLDGLDPGVTGLALLAFLAEGETHLTPRRGAAVQKGLEYLLSIQSPEGCFGPMDKDTWAIFCHGFAALAVIEAAGMTGDVDLDRAAQKGVYFVLQCQNPYLGWRYGVRPQDNDTSVTALMVMILRVAEETGLDIDPGACEGGKAWFQKVTEPESGHVGYTARRQGIRYKAAGGIPRFPLEKTEGTTAQATLGELFASEPRGSEFVRRGIELCLKSPVAWEVDPGTVDFYYWHFGSLALFQDGEDAWTRWRDGASRALLVHQLRVKDTDTFGSWDPVDPWSFAGGRVYATAINCLTLQTPYRYARVR
jgi:hypothetical protein